MSVQSRVTSRCDVAHCGPKELHHFLSVLLRGMLLLFSIVTLGLLHLSLLRFVTPLLAMAVRIVKYPSYLG